MKQFSLLLYQPILCSKKRKKSCFSTKKAAFIKKTTFGELLFNNRCGLFGFF
jgi:hypothetical protein